jgi:hypothetical protein
MPVWLRGAFLTGTLVAGLTLVSQPAMAAPSESLVASSASTKRAVVLAVNEFLGSFRSDRCFQVWVTRSNPNWATWSWVNRVPASCRPRDGFPTFFRRSAGGGFAFAGDVKPAWSNRVTCRFVTNPPAQVARDFGCDRWSVKP